MLFSRSRKATDEGCAAGTPHAVRAWPERDCAAKRREPRTGLRFPYDDKGASAGRAVPHGAVQQRAYRKRMLRPPPHAKTPARGGKGFASKRSGPKIRFFACRARNVPHKFVFLRNEYPLKTKPDMDETIKLHDRQFKVLIPAARIDEAVTDVARRINSDYAARETPLFLGVLNGSFMFLSDLMKKIEFNCELSFVKLASYEGTGSTGEVKNLIGLNNDLAGRHVVIVEDIVDTGGSIEHMVRELERHRPASIEICTLFFKPASYARTIPVRYRALEIGNEFIVGYGLDYNQLGRNLKDVYVVTE